MSTINIYVLYPCGRGFSVNRIDYTGTKITVAATSVRQAYAVAHRRTWINPGDTHPVGVVGIYRRGIGTTLWCGCSGHDVTGGQVAHGAGVTALREAIKLHPCTRSTLRERLAAADANGQG